MVISQDVARSLYHSEIATPHLIIGLIREEQGVGARVLDSFGITADAVKDLLIPGNAPEGSVMSPKAVNFNEEAKKALESALKEALSLRHTYIGTEHILLGLTRMPEAEAWMALTQLGVTAEAVAERTMEFLKRDPSASTREAASAGVSGARPGSSPKASKLLDEFGRNLTFLASEGKLDPVVGRQKEIERVIQILARRTKNNPVLIGQPGVGKTAVVEGVAQMISSGEVPEFLKDVQIYSLDLGAVIAGTRYRGEFEERLKKVIKEATTRTDIILFIDEMHTLVGAGSAEGAIDASSILKPPLARGEMRLIGATTLNEYRKYVEKDAALERRFQSIVVDEPSVEDTVKILRGLRSRYEEHHHCIITDEALQSAAEWGDRYISDRQLPDKAIDLIDEACSRLHLNFAEASQELRDMDTKLSGVRAEKDSAISGEDFEKAATLRDEENTLRDEIKAQEKIEKTGPRTEIGPEEVAAVVAMWTGIPVFKLTDAESLRLQGMEEELHKRVIGQDEAIKAVSKAIRRARAGIKDPARPTGSFLFLGPTGVGKTELARTLAKFLFDDEDAMLQIDMSEYMEKHAVSRLVGSPPGYVGYNEGGQLTEAVRRKPYSVVLFDEIEKAHPDIANVLLQVLEEGTLTDSHGKKVDFRNTIIVMTSNLGAGEIARKQSFGFSGGNSDADDRIQIKANATNALKTHFRPELLNRIDEIVVFDRLTRDQIVEIVGKMLSGIQERLGENGAALALGDKVKELIVENGYDPSYGARPLRRALQRFVEDPLADYLLSEKVEPGDLLCVEADEEGQVSVTRHPAPDNNPAVAPELVV